VDNLQRSTRGFGSDVEGFVLSGHDTAIIANWVRGDGIWHVDTARRPSVLSDFREASGHASALARW